MSDNPAPQAYVFAFDRPPAATPRPWADLLGEKGANLAEMTALLRLPVPPGFTVTTEACEQVRQGGWPDLLTRELDRAVADLEARMGRSFGDPDHPLLLAVRAGGRRRTLGTTRAVLGLGLTDRSVEGLAAHTDRRFALEGYLRLIERWAHRPDGPLAQDIESRFARARAAVEREAEVPEGAALPLEALASLVGTFHTTLLEVAGRRLPQDPRAQLREAVQDLFAAWYAPAAMRQRRREGTAPLDGTAINVQAMVFGDLDEDSAAALGSTRHPATGESTVTGEFLVSGRAEELRASHRRAEPLTALSQRFPAVHAELLQISARLEGHYRDVLDYEFTVEQGRLWVLRARPGRRGGAGALRLAVAMAEDPAVGLSKEEALLRVDPEHLEQVLHPTFAGTGNVIARGLPASPGAAVGRVYFSADDALDAYNRGEEVILVRQETSPEDVHGMEVSQGILTTRGGLASHAAVVARGWGIPAVVGAEGLVLADRGFSAAGLTVPEGTVISLDGTTGEVMLDELTTLEAAPPPEFDLLLGWADEVRRGQLLVLANADNAVDARRARRFGAEGIGLCRTEHMFLGDRLPLVRRAILAADGIAEAEALEALGRVQRQDFEEILEVMDGLPVTVRLLDPPLHEFLPSLEQILVAEARGDELGEHEVALGRAARFWHEQNPMLGTRGVRLGILRPGLYRMQVNALVQAAVARKAAGGDPRVGIMIPLVVSHAELALVRGWVSEEVEAAREGVELDITIGTMIETPRAALRAEEIARAADFFSFGTNDLTQMTFGFSRDDVEGRIMARYLEEGLLEDNPFDTLDLDGVGELVTLGTSRGRLGRPGLEVGVCGEHGGDPRSIDLFLRAGVDYISCSPYRVPIARLAAAHAVIRAKGPAAVTP